MIGFDTVEELEGLVYDILAQLKTGLADSIIIGVTGQDGEVEVHYVGKQDICRACVAEGLMEKLVNLEIPHGETEYVPNAIVH